MVDHYDLKVTEVARLLKVGRPAVSNLLNGNSGLSSEMAIRFEKLFGIPAETMMRMQTTYDLTNARKHEDEIEVERLELVA